MIGKEAGSEKERSQSYKLAKQKIENNEWEMVRGSRTDCLKVNQNSIIIAIPFVSQANDRDLRIREFIGKLYMYKAFARQIHLDKKLSFQVLGANIPKEIDDVLESLNDE